MKYLFAFTCLLAACTPNTEPKQQRPPASEVACRFMWQCTASDYRSTTSSCSYQAFRLGIAEYNADYSVCKY